MTALNWHGDGDGNYRAWASQAYPEDSMPPAYLLIKLDGTARLVKLMRGELGQRTVEAIGGRPAANLAEAKSRAQQHYLRVLSSYRKRVG